MELKRTDEFRADAVQTALSIGLIRKQVADDLGVGMSRTSTIISLFLMNAAPAGFVQTYGATVQTYGVSADLW